MLKQRFAKHEEGLSLLEMLASTAILLIVIAIIMAAMMQLMSTQGSIANRTGMHRSVRSATELLQQEIGQAGGISLPGPVTLTAATASGIQTASVSSSTGMFVGMYLDVDTGANFEIVQATAIGANTVTAQFTFAHAANAQIIVSGSFGTGIVPPADAPANYTNGSTGSVLKLYGDINHDGNILYVEYTCVPGTPTAPGFLYRNEIPFTSASKPAVTAGMVLLSNLLPNPDGSACFAYQTDSGKSGNTYVVDVAVTLTVQTQVADPQTHQLQQETKALLNVSPRNVFEAWELDNASSLMRIQPMPASVALLLP